MPKMSKNLIIDSDPIINKYFILRIYFQILIKKS